MKRRESEQRLVQRRPVQRRGRARRLEAALLSAGFGGVLLAAIGIVASIWWLVLLGVALLAILAWRVVRPGRGPLRWYETEGAAGRAHPSRRR